jgi:hypothetical protein
MNLYLPSIFRKSFTVLLFVSLASVQADSSAGVIRAYCNSIDSERQSLLAPGDVIRKFGKPKHKVEYEASQKEVWIYTGLAVEFKKGLPHSVKCKKNSDEGASSKPPVDSSQGSLENFNTEIAATQDSAGFSEALNELTKNSPDQVEQSSGVQSGANISLPTLRPLGGGQTPPSFPQVNTLKE